MAGSLSLKKPFDGIVGLRDANHGSGVGLFNRQLALRLGVANCRLDEDFARASRCPLFSFKFEELAPRHRRRLQRWHAERDGPYALFLHTVDNSRLETDFVRQASVVYCGNAAIEHNLRARGVSTPLVAAFAPSLLEAEVGEPGSIELFYFGMASKIDRERFVRLRHLLGGMARECRLLCSLSVHQTSDGSCLEKACDFFRGVFGDRFLFLGTLTDEGLAYFLDSRRIFLGFYRQGVRANNTTFNTALRYGMRILTHIDQDSPAEVRHDPAIADLDAITPSALRRFLKSKAPGVSPALSERFSWDRLIALLKQPLPMAWRRAA